MHYMHYMHCKDYIHHDFYVYSPVLLTQYLGHCWHTPCTELYILRISAWLLRKPPLPCHRGGVTIWLGEGGVWGSLLIYTHIHILVNNYYRDKNYHYQPTSMCCCAAVQGDSPRCNVWLMFPHELVR